MPHDFLFAGLLRSISAPSNTTAPHAKPIAVRLANGTVELSVDPGSTGIIHGNHVAAAPRSAELHRIRIPAVKDRVNALVDFPLPLTDLNATL
jgi:hypothetical protein